MLGSVGYGSARAHDVVGSSDTKADVPPRQSLPSRTSLIETHKIAHPKLAPFLVELKRDRQLQLTIAIKSADIGHSSKPLALHKHWTAGIVEEFFEQGDEEKARGLEVSPFMDREHSETPKNQKGFFEFIVLPLYEVVTRAAPELGFLERIARANNAYWSREWDKEQRAQRDRETRKKRRENRMAKRRNRKLGRKKMLATALGIESKASEERRNRRAEGKTSLPN